MAQRRRTREQWRRLVEGWPGSGLTQGQYCARHGVSVGSFYRWREQLRGVPDADERIGRLERAEPLRLLPVELLAGEAPPAAGSALTLVLGEHLRLQIAPGFDGDTLTRVVRLLQAEPMA